MRIALPSIWFHRGQTVVTQTLARALRELGHEVFIHARMGAVYGELKQEKVRWGWDNYDVTYWPEYDLKADLAGFLGKLKAQEIDLVLFNEEYDWELVSAVCEAGFRVATYLDYLHKDWLGEGSPLAIYDRILCSTHRSLEMMPPGTRSAYIGWGIPEGKIIWTNPATRPYLFFENAGWLGLNDRKGLRTMLECYQTLLECHPKLYGSLLVHAQPQLSPDPKRLWQGVDLMTGSMNHPGLYHMAQVYCYPAILDGLGLSLLEAIASVCAVICPDAPPWNEFVEHERNGLLVPIIGERKREDGIAFPEVFCDKKAFIAAMERLAEDEELRARLCKGSAGVAGERLGWDAFKGRIAASLGGLA